MSDTSVGATTERDVSVTSLTAVVHSDKHLRSWCIVFLFEIQVAPFGLKRKQNVVVGGISFPKQRLVTLGPTVSTPWGSQKGDGCLQRTLFLVRLGNTQQPSVETRAGVWAWGASWIWPRRMRGDPDRWKKRESRRGFPCPICWLPWKPGVPSTQQPLEPSSTRAPAKRPLNPSCFPPFLCQIYGSQLCVQSPLGFASVSTAAT